MTRRFGVSEIMAPNPFMNVLTRPDIPPTSRRAAQNVNVKHGEKLVHRAGGIRTHDLLNPIQAFYQAELRPDLKQTIDQLRANRQFSGQLRPFYQVRHGESILCRTE